MITIHDDVDLFRAAVEMTAARTSFQPRLVEKDYYASVALEHLSQECPQLVFKGGTCLAKVHMNFFRLSEDLDFVIPTRPEAKRSERSKAMKKVKARFNGMPRALPCFRIEEAMTGANVSTQYIGLIAYTSIFRGQDEKLKVEVSLREPLVVPANPAKVRSLLMNPLTDQPLVPAFAASVIALREAFAEKLRAAMTRREVAIRDFFDLDHAVSNHIISPDDPELLTMTRIKLAVPGNSPVNLTEERLEELKPQVEAHLAAVLSENELNRFDVTRAFRMVQEIATKIA